MKQLGHPHSYNKFQLANTRHRSFKCMILSNIVYFQVWCGIDVLIVSLQSVLYCLPTPPFTLLHCWMRNSIASISKHTIQLALMSVIKAQLCLILWHNALKPTLLVHLMQFIKLTCFFNIKVSLWQYQVNRYTQIHFCEQVMFVTTFQTCRIILDKAANQKERSVESIVTDFR